MTHLNHRLLNPNKKNHWIVPWIVKNLSPYSAMSVYFWYVKSDISCLDDTKGLLAEPLQFFPIYARNPLYQGCYLYYNRNDKFFI